MWRKLRSAIECLRALRCWLRRSGSGKLNLHLFCEALDIGAGIVVFLGLFEVLEHERRLLARLRDFGEIGTVIDAAASGPDLDKVNLVLDGPLQIFGMTRDDPRTEQPEALLDYFCVVVKTCGRVNDVADIEVNGEGFPIDRFDQLEIAIGPIRQRP